jgi:hydrogenase maturation protease
MKTILVGLGNPILGDDACGWKVVDQVKQQVQQKSLLLDQDIDTIFLAVGGLELMEHLIGYDRAVIVDAVSFGNAAPGTVSVQSLDNIPDFSGGHTTSVHDTSLINSIRLARRLGLKLPVEIVVVGIETRPLFNFSENLTAEIAEMIPMAVQYVIDLLNPAEMDKI